MGVIVGEVGDRNHVVRVGGTNERSLSGHGGGRVGEREGGSSGLRQTVIGRSAPLLLGAKLIMRMVMEGKRGVGWRGIGGGSGRSMNEGDGPSGREREGERVVQSVAR